jgi:hypothetical protein
MEKVSFYLIVLILPLASCISVNLKSEEPKSLSSLSFTLPPKWNFSQISLKDEHHHFQSQKTGNLISIQSHCPSSSQSLLQELSYSLSQPKWETKPLDYQIDERATFETIIKGYKEGIPFKIRLIQYEKLGCQISAFYLAQDAFYATEESDFETLFKSLKAKP